MLQKTDKKVHKFFGMTYEHPPRMVKQRQSCEWDKHHLRNSGAEG